LLIEEAAYLSKPFSFLESVTEAGGTLLEKMPLNPCLAHRDGRVFFLDDSLPLFCFFALNPEGLTPSGICPAGLPTIPSSPDTHSPAL